MPIACFACGAKATTAVSITYRDRPLGDGFVCDGCAGGKAVAALRDEHYRLYREGVSAEMIERMIRQRVQGERAEA